MIEPKKELADSVTVNTTSTKILSANKSRRWASITNTHTVILWISFGGPAVAGKGYGIPAGTTAELTNSDGNLWRGEVYGIYASTSSVVGFDDLS